MKNIVLNYISTFVSMIGYFHFFSLIFRPRRTKTHTFLFLLALNAVFCIIVALCDRIPNPVTGMLVKTFGSTFLTVLAGKYLFYGSYLNLTLALAADIAVLSVVEVIMGGVVDFSAYIDPASEVFSYEADLLINIVRTSLCIIVHTLLYRLYRNIRLRVPLRYYMPLVFLFLTHILLLTSFSYYRYSSTRLASWFFVVLILSCLLSGILPILLLNDQNYSRKLMRRAGHVERMKQQLENQLDFVTAQNQSLEELDKEVRRYKKEADFSRSIEPLFYKQEDYLNGLYCDDPLTNTQLLYYAEQFRKAGIPFSCSVDCSLDSADHPDFILMLISGLLSTVKDTASFSLSAAGNLYTVRFETGIGSYKALKQILQTIASEFKSLGVTYKFGTTDSTVPVTLHFQFSSSASPSGTAYESHH